MIMRWLLTRRGLGLIAAGDSGEPIFSRVFSCAARRAPGQNENATG